jgi:Tfp pilus assembly protein PilN
MTRTYLLAVCLVGLAGLGYMFHVWVQEAEEELSILQGRSTAMHQQLDLRDSLESQLADLMIKKRIEERLGRRVGTLGVLGELQRVMPESMALTGLTMETVEVHMPASAASAGSSSGPGPRGSAKQEKAVKRVRLVITGLAPTDVDVANFIGQLASSPVFEDVNMGYARNVAFRSRNARKFQASCYVTR